MNEVGRQYSQRYLSPLDVQKKLRLSASEIGDLKPRDVKCPYCGFVVSKVYADIKGHMLMKCRKCKNEAIINLAYFRKQKQYLNRKRKYAFR